MSVPAEEPAGGGGELNFVSSSQHELGAIMVVANMQFPPLQVMVLSVEDASDGLASCFDLLQKAVMNAHVTLGKLCSLLTGKSEQEIAGSKQSTVEKLQKDLAAFYAQTAVDTDPTICENVFLDGSYELYCAAFRTYLLEHYPDSMRDLHFFPFASVASDSVLMSQGTSHWNASRLSLVCDTCGGDYFGSYSQLICAYAIDLATLSE